MNIEKRQDVIVSNDWTRNWQASISVKITAIALWPTIIVVFITAFYFLNDLEEQVKQEQYDTSVKIAYHASDLWPESKTLTFHQKLEKLRNDYHELHLPGFELLSKGQTYKIGNLEIQPSFYDFQLHTRTGDDSPLEIRIFFPDARQAAEILRNKIIAIILLSLILLGVFLTVSTRVILDKPLQGLVDAAQKISEGHQQVRVDTSREDEFGTLSRFFNKMVDTLLEQKNLVYEAKTDFLTGLANRRHFDETIKYELRRNARVHNPLTLIMCDVDFFKQYNDLYNHIAGDLCLKHIARALESICNRAGDLVARYGGEEFVIILPNTDKETGSKIANAIREELKKLKIPHSGSSVNQYVTLSIGVATLADSGVSLLATNLSATNLIESADKALYIAKQNGRDRVEVVEVSHEEEFLQTDSADLKQTNTGN